MLYSVGVYYCFTYTTIYLKKYTFNMFRYFLTSYSKRFFELLQRASNAFCSVLFCTEASALLSSRKRLVSLELVYMKLFDSCNNGMLTACLLKIFDSTFIRCVDVKCLYGRLLHSSKCPFGNWSHSGKCHNHHTNTIKIIL